MKRNLSSAPRGLRSTMASSVGGALVVFSWPIPRPTRDHEALSAAEREIVALLVEGCTYAEIASDRGTSLGTVKKQIASAYRKLGVGSRAELVARWLDR